MDADSLTALLQVILADLVLAGDNAIVVGMVAASLPPDLRKKAIFIGIFAATAMRVMFAAVTIQLLAIIGLTLAGGLLLLWVAWKLWREIQADMARSKAEKAREAGGGETGEGEEAIPGAGKAKNFRQAIVQIVIADASMSLDNVLAVAGAARDHMVIMAIGLTLSIALMAVASTFIANLLQKHRWIAYVGLVVILYIALDMIHSGAVEVMGAAQKAGFGF